MLHIPAGHSACSSGCSGEVLRLEAEPSCSPAIDEFQVPPGHIVPEDLLHCFWLLAPPSHQKCLQFWSIPFTAAGPMLA